MLPVVAIVGRPNVGKSTLFNCLTRSRRAVVASMPGVTRDRQYGVVQHPGHPFIVVDTGGLEIGARGFDYLVSRQSRRALEEADVAILLLDAREGLTAGDRELAELSRRECKRVLVVGNKMDGLEDDAPLLEFHALGLGDPIGISAAHSRGIGRLSDALASHFPEPEAPAPGDLAAGPHIAIVGRPNVGKSTLINHMAGEERVIAHERPGTTRDSVEIPIRLGSLSCTLVDTAGIRRRRSVSEAVEKFSVIKALAAIHSSDAVVLLLDATESVSEQDTRLLAHVIEAGRALAIGVNKCDRLDDAERRRVRGSLERRFAFADFAYLHFISAREGRGVAALLRSAMDAHRAAHTHFSTGELTRTLHEAVARHPPPMVRGRRIRLRYAHQGGTAPPRLIVHGNQTDSVPESYRRYLAGVFRRRFALRGTPLLVEFRTGDNPFEGRKNELSDRQRRRRKRLVRHAKR